MDSEKKEYFYYKKIGPKTLYKCTNCIWENNDFARMKRHLCSKIGCVFEQQSEPIDETVWERKSVFLIDAEQQNRGGGKWQTKMRMAQMKVKKEEIMAKDEEKGENKNEMTSGVVARKRKREQKEEMSETKRIKDEGQKQLDGEKRGKEKGQKQMDGAKRGKKKNQEKMTNECNIEGTKKEEMDEKNGENVWLEMRKNAGGYYNKIAWKGVELEKKIVSEEKCSKTMKIVSEEKISKTVKIVDDEEERLEIYESEEEELNEENEDARLQGRNDLTLDCIDALMELGNGPEEIDGTGMEENVIKGTMENILDQIGQKNKMANELVKEGEDEEVKNIVDNLFEDAERNGLEDKQNKERLAAEKEANKLAKKKSEIEEERKIKYWVLIDGKALKINNFEEQKLYNYMEEERQKVLDEIREERIKREKLNEEKRQWDEQLWEKRNRPKRSCVEEQMQLAKSIEESKNEGKKELKRKEKKDEKKLKDEVTDLKRENKEAKTVNLMQAKWIEELESQRKKDDEEIRNLKIENEKMRKKLIEIEMEAKIKKWRKLLKKGKISIADFEVVKFCIEEDVEENAMIKLILDERKKREERKRVDQISKIIPSAFMLPKFCPVAVASRTFCFPIELWF